jgi:hypothetical protein
MDRIPSDSLDSSNGRFAQAFDAESRDFIKDATSVLEWMVRRASIRAERLPASPAPVATTLPPRGLVEVMTMAPSSDFPDGGHCPFGQLRLFIVRGPYRA